MADQNIVQEVLGIIDCNNEINTLTIATLLDVDHQKIVGTIKSLNEFKDFIEIKQLSEKKWQPTQEGDLIVDRGSHEFIVWSNVPSGDEGIDKNELNKLIDSNTVNIGIQKGLALKWLGINKVDGKQLIVKKLDTVQDDVKGYLEAIKKGNINVSNFRSN